ncbi:hypothetical protein BDW02DRAFT_571642 [Decorospora gaudefroyi]|uniref:Uncharacterized protein n=1 Tax=Decorospora gaudefroyi TaxID=184978 RepID=A0A6A5K9U8_9PLEO|nr:hypothetical protein BDW02DRAFT_571642 [Decorospora gaudefroyi]
MAASSSSSSSSTTATPLPTVWLTPPESLLPQTHNPPIDPASTAISALLTTTILIFLSILAYKNHNHNHNHNPEINDATHSTTKPTPTPTLKSWPISAPLELLNPQPLPLQQQN